MSINGGKRNRDHLHIITEILEQCQKPQTKWAIVTSLNLSHKMLVSYLTELEYTKLIETPPNITSNYKITQKGKEYLRKFRELQNIADFSAVNCYISTSTCNSTKKISKQIQRYDQKFRLLKF